MVLHPNESQLQDEPQRTKSRGILALRLFFPSESNTSSQIDCPSLPLFKKETAIMGSATLPVLFGVAETDECLRQILNLQTRNHSDSISQQELNSEGYVTVRHSADLLQRMNTPHPHVVAREGVNRHIVGYTLVLDPEHGAEIPLLEAMFQRINATEYEGKLLRDRKYFVMGQVCIAKE